MTEVSISSQAGVFSLPFTDIVLTIFNPVVEDLYPPLFLIQGTESARLRYDLVLF